MKKIALIVFFSMIMASCSSFVEWIKEPQNYTEMLSVVERYLNMQGKQFVVAPSFGVKWQTYALSADEAGVTEYVGIFVGDDSEKDGKLVQFKCDAVKAYEVIAKKASYTFSEVCQPLQGWVTEPLVEDKPVDSQVSTPVETVPNTEIAPLM